MSATLMSLTRVARDAALELKASLDAAPPRTMYITADMASKFACAESARVCSLPVDAPVAEMNAAAAALHEWAAQTMEDLGSKEGLRKDAPERCRKFANSHRWIAEMHRTAVANAS